MMRCVLLLSLLLGTTARAEPLLAARTLAANRVLTRADVKPQSGDAADVAAEVDSVLGLETRVMIHAGRPIRAEDLRPPALIERNQSVTLVFQRGGLKIEAEGRALGRGGTGETLRAMNLRSKSIVAGRVAPDGTLRIDDPARSH